MRMVAHIAGDARPTAFEPDAIVMNVWGEMLLATIYFESCAVEARDDGWDLVFDGLDITSFPYREVTLENLPAVISEHPAEVSIVGTDMHDDEGDDGDSDFFWDEAHAAAVATFWEGDEEVARCESCRFRMYAR